MVFSGRLSKCRVINAELDKPESWKETWFRSGWGPESQFEGSPGDDKKGLAPSKGSSKAPAVMIRKGWPLAKAVQRLPQ